LVEGRSNDATQTLYTELGTGLLFNFDNPIGKEQEKIAGNEPSAARMVLRIFDQTECWPNGAFGRDKRLNVARSSTRVQRWWVTGSGMAHFAIPDVDDTV